MSHLMPKLRKCVLSHFSHVRLSATPGIVACPMLLSMGFSRQEFWSALPCPSPKLRKYNMPSWTFRPLWILTQCYWMCNTPQSLWETYVYYISTCRNTLIITLCLYSYLYLSDQRIQFLFLPKRNIHKTGKNIL